MRILFALPLAAILATPAFSQTIYPIDRADILAGSRFDFKVEFPDTKVTDVTVNGQPYEKVLGNKATLIEKEEGKEQSALVLRDVTLKPGKYEVKVGGEAVTWNVYPTGARKAKNVILFIGDGLSLSHRVAARILSKGIDQGKSNGKMAIDDMPRMALVATAGSDSIITDSANSASAYATGHKAVVNAMGVYGDRTANPFDDPKVETIGELAKKRGLALGIVTNTEIEDATPAAMATHTRRRSTYDQIVEQFFDAKPDVLMGGGRANFLPQSHDDGKRKDQNDYIAKFKDAGYRYAATATEMNAAANDASTTKLLGLFALGNLDGVLDRKFLKGGTVKKFPDQPDLTDQVKTALTVLSKNQNGFFLMVESGLIDKYAHALDFDRAVYDVIMLDNAVRQAKEWAKARGEDTLIMVVADHSHPNSLVGTIEDDMTTTPNVPMRERVGVYEKAGFPDYPKANAEGYPEKIDVKRRLAIFSAALPDHYETFRPKMDAPFSPTVAGTEKGTFVANEAYKNVPGAVLRMGNLPAMMNSSVHSGEDVILTGTGPGSERIQGQMDNTEVFRVIVDALGMAPGE